MKTNENLESDRFFVIYGMTKDMLAKLRRDAGKDYSRKDYDLTKHKGYRFTIVGYIDTDDTLYASYSICSPYDNFSKRIGKTIAKNRIITHLHDRPLHEVLMIEENFKKDTKMVKKVLKENAELNRKILHSINSIERNRQKELYTNTTYYDLVL